MGGYDAFVSYSHTADGRLAPELQRGLQRLAKRPLQRRALRVFRDETGLSTNPHLWEAIASAIDDSEWFVLLASPESARSDWVRREVSTWLATKPAERVLVVVTDGEIAFGAAGPDRALTTCLPDPLLDALVNEPRWLDLRWARNEEQLDLRNGRFRAAVADLAAPIHGVAKEDLEGEDVRLQKRARRLAIAGVGAVAVLGVAALIAAGVAVSQQQEAADQRDVAQAQRQEAETQRQEAENQRAEADSQRQEAEAQRQDAATQRDEAQSQRDRADEQANVATARSLAAQAATLDASDIDLGLLLGAEAYNRMQTLDIQDGLLTALDNASGLTALVRSLPKGTVDVSISPDRATLYVLTATGEVWPVEDHDLDTTSEPLTAGLGQPFSQNISRDGRRLIVAVADGATVIDLATGDVIAASLLGERPTSASLSEDGSLAAVGSLKGGFLRVYEVATGRVVWETPATEPSGVFLPDRRIAVSVFGSTYVAIHSLDADPVTPIVSRQDLPAGDRITVSPDESLLIVGGAEGTAQLVDTTTLEPVSPVLTVRGSRTGDFFFSPSGRFVGLGSDDGSARLFDVGSGHVVEELVGMQGALWSEFLDETSVISAGFYDDAAALWGLDSPAAIGRTTAQFPGPVPKARTVDDGSNVVLSVGADVWISPVADPLSPTVTYSSEGTVNRALSVVESAQLAAVYTVVVLDGETGRAERFVHILRLPDLSEELAIPFGEVAVENISLSPDGTRLAVGRRDGQLAVYDVATGAAVLEPKPVDTFPFGLGLLVWSQDGRALYTGGQDGTLRAFDTTTWAQLWEHVLAPDMSALRLGRLTPDGARIIVPVESGAVWIVDAATGAPIGEPYLAAGTQLQVATMVRDGELLVAESADGRLRMWEVSSHRQLGPAMDGHAGASEALDVISTTSVLSSSPFDSRVITWDLDADSWAQRACSIAGRNLTHDEWARYVGGEYQATCPEFPEGT